MPFSKWICFILLLSFQSAFAQRATIRGTAYDQQNKQTIAYASVTLLKTADSTVLNGTITKANGAFELLKVLPGTYRLTIASVGYHSTITDVFVVGTSGSVDLGTILLAPSQQMLKEMQVTGKKAGILNKMDKQVYRADQFESARGGTAIDVLKNLPSVTVNGEGGISVRGSTGFLVLINGKPVITDAQTVLSQLPANSLQNIELITSPSAKYDPDGKAGIINIVTKKGATDGLTLNANAQGGLPSTTDHGNKEKPKRFGADITVNYRKGKWDISASGNYLRADVAGYREGDVYTKNFTTNTLTRFPSNGERSFVKYNYAGRTSVSYTADTSNLFSAGFFTGHRFQSRLADLLYNNSASSLSTGTVLYTDTYFNSNLQTKEGTFSLGNLDYTHTFRNKSTLTTSVLYEHANLYGNTKNRNLQYPNTTDTIQYVLNPYRNPINGYRLKMDYGVAIGKGKLESGYQFRYDTQDGQFDYLVTPAISQPDADRFRGGAKAKNQIHAVYTQYSGKKKQWDYTAGLRYEYATRRVELSYAPTPHKLNLSNLFPSATLLYAFKDGWQAKAGYSKRVQRTTNFELNPIPEREHSETLEQGDPDLLPEFIDLVEGGIIHNYKSGSFFINGYYQGIQHPIQRVNSVYADTILNRVFTNAGHARTIGLEAGATLHPYQWWTLYAGGNVYNYKIKGPLTILGITFPASNGSWVYSINANTSFQLANTWTLQGNVNYLSRRPTAQGEDSRFLVPNTSVKKTFMNGRLAATLQWQNMDLGFKQSNRQRITTMAPDFYTTTNYIYETDVFLINLSFNLNKLSSKAKLPGSEFGDKEF